MADYSHGYDKMTDAQLLEKVKKGWQCEETPCGSGSTLRNTEQIRRQLPSIVAGYRVYDVADAGAGDRHWIDLVEWDVRYTGYDLYPRHPDVKQFDITKQVLPKVDLILCRHVLNHLSIQYAQRAIDGFVMSGSRYLLMTNCDNQRMYWREYGLRVGRLVETFNECQHWDLELYDLLSAN